MSRPDAESFASRWCADWNARDLEALLSHFSDDVVFTSPVAQRILGSDGLLRSKDALRAYWILGLERVPDLHFTLEAVYAGTETIVINYRNQVGSLACEVLHFDGDLVREGHGTYLEADNPEGAGR